MDQMSCSKGEVCVTGATGYVASWLIKRLLLSGYHVTGTARDPEASEKVGHLWSLEGAKERLRLVKADLLVEGSFDAAIIGCEGVFHTASPVGQPSKDPKIEILQPAIDGTLNVLRSCKKNPLLRRVVLTSSSSTIRVRDDIAPNASFDETSWSSPKLLEKLKNTLSFSRSFGELQDVSSNDALGAISSLTLIVEEEEIWYILSKTLAEKAAWEFCEENKIDLVTVLPSFVIGPSLPPVLCTTASEVLGLLRGETEQFQRLERMGYVHIDDVALSHILVYDIVELAAILSARYPNMPILKRFEKVGPHYELDVSKLKELGMKFRSIEDMFDDYVDSLTKQGHLSSVLDRPVSEANI